MQTRVLAAVVVACASSASAADLKPLPEARVSSDTTEASGTPTVTMDAEGDFLVVWEFFDPDDAVRAAEIRARLFEPLLTLHLHHFFDNSWWANPRCGPFLQQEWWPMPISSCRPSPSPFVVLERLRD